MGSSGLVEQIYDSFLTGLIIVAPPMIAAMVVGVLLAILMAATQIQDQTLPQLVKIIVILAVLIVGGVPMSAPLFEYSRTLFASFHTMTR
ncbi:MAG: flagellar biosynthetic protein FliQ [Salinarimonas sp.]|nr:flagellar biosynthetic protein FliQ [Salinarimonas sp.]